MAPASSRSRRSFLTHVGSMGLGLGLGPVLASCLQGRAEGANLAPSQAVKTGNATHLTILHTADIHAQLEIHDEFFYEHGTTHLQTPRRLRHAAHDDRRAAAAESAAHAGRRRRRLLPGQCGRGAVEGAGDHASHEPGSLRSDAARQLGGGLRQGDADQGHERLYGRQGLREHVPLRRRRTRRRSSRRTRSSTAAASGSGLSATTIR